jgi:hypothetical protein
MSLLSFCEWLATTSASIALHESRYVYLIVLTTHVMTLFLFLGAAVVVDLRLLGVTLRQIPVTETIDSLFPWGTAGFALMIVSGVLLFYAAPVDRYENLFFRLKLVLLILAVTNRWIFYKVIYPSVAGWNLNPVPPRKARVIGAIGLFLWVAIITAGRMIPYQAYWF